MNGTQNLNFAECLKSINNIGSTTYQNVCDGTQSVVPWGTSDWLLSAFVVIFLILLATIFLGMITDTYRHY